jgi:hypothetical protein
MPDELETAADWATSLLLGQGPRSLAQRLHEVGATDAARVQDAVRAAWPTVQVLLPVDADPGIADVAECRHDQAPVTGRAHRGNPFAGLLPGARMPLPLSASLTEGEDGLTLRLAGQTCTVRWHEVAAVVRQADGLTVLGVDGTTILLPDGTFFGGREIRRQVEERVDPGLFLDAPDLAGTD